MKELTLNEYISLYESGNLNKIYGDFCNDHKGVEAKDAYILFKELSKTMNEPQDVGGFYFGIPSPIYGEADFDILKISKSKIVNIQLKDEVSMKKTREQFLNKIIQTFEKQNVIINILKDKSNNIKHSYNILFIRNEGKVFLEEKNNLSEISFNDVLDILSSSQSKEISEDVNYLENLLPSDYLISPISDPDKFINNKYLLTQEQKEVKRKINNCIKKKNSMNVLAVSGEAGTGKTLLALDIARELSNSYEIVYIFGGNLKDGHDILKNELPRIHFLSALDAQQYDENELLHFDIIIVDEAQRLRRELVSKLGSWSGKGKNKGKYLLFFKDENQILGPKDSGAVIQNMSQITPLKKVIRTNKYISYIIDVLLHGNRVKSRYIKTNFSEIQKNDFLYKVRKNVKFKFFKNSEYAQLWINQMVENGYKFLAPTEDRYNKSSSDLYTGYENTHNAIGKQYPLVVTYIDENLIFEDGKLKQKNSEYYYLEREFYTNATRATNKLAIAVVNNTEVFDRLIDLTN